MKKELKTVENKPMEKQEIGEARPAAPYKAWFVINFC